MKPVISLWPCGVAIQCIAEKTRRVGSRSKTTHRIALIPPSKTDCFLQQIFRPLTPLPKLDTISDPNSSLFSGGIARPQSRTSRRRKSWFKLCCQNWPMKLPETRSWHHTRTWCPGVYWSLLCQGLTGKNLSREQSWKPMLPSFFPLFSSWYVYLNRVIKRKKNEGLQSFQQILRCWQSTCFSGFWGSYLGIASKKSTFCSHAPT